jgi:uncharacterized protein YndB with AHSA1/START domain
MIAMNSSNATTFTTPSDREIRITRTFDAPRRLVFDAYTNPTHIPKWMVPSGWSMPTCELDLRAGGAWRYVLRDQDGNDVMSLSGIYIEVTPPERIVATETWSGGFAETRNEVRFDESDGRTTVTTTVLYPSMEARDVVMKSGMQEGMSAGLDRLADVLQTMAV